jgi:hypothetical protein
MSVRAAWIALAVAFTAPAARAAEPAGRAEAAEWSVQVGGVSGQGSGARVELHVAARAGYHVNLEYPMAFRPGPGSTVRFTAPRVPLTPSSPTECEGRPNETCAVVLTLPLQLPEKGPAHLEGTLAFSVCSKERCAIEKVSLSATLAPINGG